jgi:hypothetical protein
MTPHRALAILALLSQTGCVAAIPMAAQLVSGTNSTTQLCAMATMPGQKTSLCDRLPFGAGSQSPATVEPTQNAAHGKSVTTAAQ